MKKEGAGGMSLEVAENNSAAREFYQRLGFATTGRISKYYAGRVDAEVMEKAI
jgi:ribosomal protein S18 acetylase RimI-like enzyme